MNTENDNKMSNPQKTTLHEFLYESAESALNLQRENGSFPASSNDVYNELETPVRTTSYWLIVLAEVYDRTGNMSLREAAEKAGDYLLSSEARPQGYTFQSRKTEGVDKCDGLVGQHGPIRALTRAGKILQKPEYLETARAVFHEHPFDDGLGLWEKVEVDGRRLSYDRTLNHQTVFAASASTLAKHDNKVASIVTKFLNRLGDNMRVDEDGLIKHYVRPGIQASIRAVVENRRHWPLLWNEAVVHIHRFRSARKVKEVGYYPTVMTSLAELYRAFPEHDVWNSRIITRAKSFMKSSEYQNQIENNDSKYGSIFPQISHAKTQYYFENQESADLSNNVEEDIRSTYDPDTGLLTRNTSDKMFQAASIVALVDLPAMCLELDIDRSE